MIKRLLLALCLGLCLSSVVSAAESAAGGQPSQTPPANNLLFILDASGSMWGRIDDTPKIVIAKEVMSSLVADLPDDAKAGLMAYGHRRKGDCQDIESLVALGPLDRDTMIEHIDGLNAKGKTPITASVKQAIEQLRQTEESASVVLVSDGLESCGGDPCAAVKAAKQSGVDFRLHVVGFDLGEADTSQLQCMADVGGGQFFTAANADELSNALETVAAPPKPEKTDVAFKATKGKDGPVIKHDLTWTLTNTDTGKAAIQDFDIATLTMAVEPGEYTARVKRGKDGASADKTVTVKDGERQEFTLPIVVEVPDATISAAKTAAAGATIPVSWTGPDEKSDYIAVVKPGDSGKGDVNFTYTHDGSPLKLVLPPEPGDYEIIYVQHQDYKPLARQAIKVTPIEATLSVPESAKAGATIPVSWTGPDYKKDYIVVVKPGGAVRGDFNFTYTHDGSPLKLVLPAEPGDYEIVYVQHQGYKPLARQAIKITPVEATLSVAESAKAGATIPVTWTGPDYKSDYIAVVEPGGAGRDEIKYTYTRDGSPLKLELPSKPGDYEIIYVQHQGRKALVRRAIEVQAEN